MRRAAGRRGAFVLAALLAGACVGSPSALEDAEQRAAVGSPLGRSEYLRAGQLSYRLGALERSGESLRIDLVLQNGTSRAYDHLLLRVLVHGGPGQEASARLPVGPMRAGRTRYTSARLPAVGFRVREVRVELLASTP